MRAELTGAARLLELNFRRLPVRCAHASELGALEACGELSSSAPAQLGELSLPLSLSLYRATACAHARNPSERDYARPLRASFSAASLR